MKRLSNGTLRIKPRIGQAADVNSTVTKNTAYPGEHHYAEDSGKLYHFNGSENVLILTQDSNGHVVLAGLPTSPAGLPPGGLWVDGDILKVAP